MKRCVSIIAMLFMFSTVVTACGSGGGGGGSTGGGNNNTGGPTATIALAQTGASPNSYSTYTVIIGEDGTSQNNKGAAWPNPRFTDNQNGTITDNLTGLVWLQNANCSFGGTPNLRLWSGALAAVNALQSGDCNLTDGSNAGDWRLPNRNELRSLVNHGKTDVANWLNTTGNGNPNFIEVQRGRAYWSSTTYASDPSSAWCVNLMASGMVSSGNKTAGTGFYVWAVRSQPGATTLAAPAALPETGQKVCYDNSGNIMATCASTGQDGDLQTGVEQPSPRFTIGTGTESDCVIDNFTGLMWVKAADATTRTWQEALTYAADINNGTGVCGHKDWYLPNVNELQSLVNAGFNEVQCGSGSCATNAQWLSENTNNTQTPQGVFQNVQANLYWSSTTSAGIPASAWNVSMSNGALRGNGKTSNYYVWPVRSVK